MIPSDAPLVRRSIAGDKGPSGERLVSQVGLPTWSVKSPRRVGAVLPAQKALPTLAKRIHIPSGMIYTTGLDVPVSKTSSPSGELVVHSLTLIHGRRFIPEAKDFGVFSPNFYKTWQAVPVAKPSPFDKGVVYWKSKSAYIQFGFLSAKE